VIARFGVAFGSTADGTTDSLSPTTSMIRRSGSRSVNEVARSIVVRSNTTRTVPASNWPTRIFCSRPDSTGHSLLASEGFRCAFAISMYTRFGDFTSPCLNRTSPLRSTTTRSDFSAGQYRMLSTDTFSPGFVSIRATVFSTSFESFESVAPVSGTVATVGAASSPAVKVAISRSADFLYGLCGYSFTRNFSVLTALWLSLMLSYSLAIASRASSA
jgi:hypothetical protein